VVGGTAGMSGGLALADRRPAAAARLESAVYSLAAPAVLLVLGNLFLLYFLSA
jgi:hypothetical protein